MQVRGVARPVETILEAMFDRSLISRQAEGDGSVSAAESEGIV